MANEAKQLRCLDEAMHHALIVLTQIEQCRADILTSCDDEELAHSYTSQREEAYYFESDFKLLRLWVPSLPLSLNSVTNYTKKEGLIRNLAKKWWMIKISNALSNVTYVDCPRSDISFDKAVILISFTFAREVLNDIDNYATKSIIDGLSRNGIFKDDNKDILKTMIPTFKTGDMPGTDIMVIDDDFIFTQIEGVHRRYSNYLKREDELEKDKILLKQSVEAFFDL